MGDPKRRSVYGRPLSPDEKQSTAEEYASEVLNKPRDWFKDTKVPEITNPRLKELDKPISQAIDDTFHGSYADRVAEKVMAAQQPKDGSAGWVEKASKAAINATKQARHATGADKGDSTEDGAAHLAARKNWHASVASLLAAEEARKAREAQAGQPVAHPHGLSEQSTAGGESGPTEDIYGRTHNMVERYGDNFYPQARPGHGYAPAPPGGDTYNNGEWGTVPRAPRESIPAEELPPPSPPAPASTEMLNHVRPVSFDYKPGHGEPGRNYGVLAQDLEKSPMGASLVKPDAQGVKTVNVAKAAMANLAATADLHQRVKAIEESGAVDADAKKRMRQEHVEPLPPPAPPNGGLNTRPSEHEALSNDAYGSMPQNLASDAVVKDDNHRAGSSPQAAYASRVNELTDMAKAGHPEAPRKLERLEREGSAVGLDDSQNSAPAGNLLGDDRPTVATQYARKVYKATLGRDVAPPEPGSQMDNVQRELANQDTVYGAQPAEPFERVPESTGLAGEDKTTKGEVPAPKASDAAAEPEQGPLPPQQPAYTTIAAHYQDQIGPEAWKALSESERAAFTAADAIHNRMRTQSLNDTAVAKAQSDEASARGVLALHDQRMADSRGADLDKQARDIEADAAHLANYHENPNHFWATRSSAQKVAGFIGIALGGFVQGVKGGENVALKQINQAIDRDIDAQRANFNAKKDSLNAKRSAYGMAMERYNHDDTKATHAVRLAMLDKTDAMARVAAAQHAGTDTDNRLDQFLGGQAKVRADEIIAYKKYIQTQNVSNGASMQDLQKEFGKYYSAVTEKGEQPMPFAQWAHGRMGGQVPGSDWGASTDRKATAAEKQAEADQKRTIIVDGKPRLAVNDGVVKDWNEYSHVSAEARRLYNVMQASKDGDPARFDAAQAKLVEIMPAVLGFARGPSVAQVEHTLGPAAIPNYAHWYQASLSSRVDTKLEDLGKSLDTLDKSTREHTLGQTGTATVASQGEGATTPKTFKEAK